MKCLTLSVTIFTLLSTCVQADSDPYGLLFTAPEQRARLDNRFNDQSPRTDSSSATGNAQAQLAHTLKLNGTLISSSGKKEVWINGESQFAAGNIQTGNIRLLNADKVRVKASASARAHDMKPGQILDPNTGTVNEAFQQTVTPPLPADNIQ